MNNINNLFKISNDVKSLNLKNFNIAMEDKEFANLVYRLDMPKEEIVKYTTKLESTVKELKNCKNCKNLKTCLNDVCGYVNFPSKKGDALIFSYTPCKYKKEHDKYKSNVVYYETSSKLKEARMKDIYIDDNARTTLLKYVKEFMSDPKNKKGIYLNGSFGSGKSYIMNAVLNELSRKNYKCVSVYYPNLLKRLKDSFNSKNESFEQMYNELEMCDVLLIDDIGAENNTLWARDEVLGSLLQSRMDNKKTTFFTSNFSLDELEQHLSETSSSIDKIKARRIIERIKELCMPISLIGESKRNRS